MLKRFRTFRPQVEQLEDRTVPAVGTWAPLVNGDPGGAGTMLLLTDGRVLVQDAGVTNTWHILTPSVNGSYVNGTWTTAASMVNTRLYMYSGVLRDGRVLVAGGEYGSGTDNGEIYDPVSNTWVSIAQEPLGDIGDCQGALLPDGRVILGYRFGPQTRIYTPGPQVNNSGSWVQGPTNSGPALADEEPYALLPATQGGGVMTVNVYAFGAERYAPQGAPGIGSWSNLAAPPVQLWDSAAEIGALVLLYDGRMMQIGSSDAGTPGHTALYTRSTNTWVAGPDIPGGSVADDAPADVMINGHLLFCADAGSEFNPPTSFFEYDPITNTMTAVPPPNGNAAGNPCFVYRFVQLPNGQVLAGDGGTQLFVYTPAGTPAASWRPTITSIVNNGGGLYTVNGRQLNGRTEGAYYGDDVQSSSNYPLVRLVNTTSGRVFYARTFNFSTMAVATGPFVSVSARFRLPAGLPAGAYTLYAVANGIASNAFSFNAPGGSGPGGQFNANGGPNPGFAEWLAGGGSSAPSQPPSPAAGHAGPMRSETPPVLPPTSILAGNSQQTPPVSPSAQSGRLPVTPAADLLAAFFGSWQNPLEMG